MWRRTDVEHIDFCIESQRLEASLHVIKEPREILRVGKVVAFDSKSSYVVAKGGRLNRT
jgi:hypothetical protein